MCFKGVLRKFQGCSNKVFSVLQGNFKGVLRNIKGCFNGVLSGNSGCLTLVNAGYFFEEITQISAPRKSPLKIDFANFVFTGA